MKLRFLVAVILLASLLGCAEFRKVTLEMSQEDVKNTETFRIIADNSMGTWATKSGAIQCAGEDYLTARTLKGVKKLDELAKEAGKFSKEDYRRGCFMGLSGEITGRQIKEWVEKLIGVLTKAGLL